MVVHANYVSRMTSGCKVDIMAAIYTALTCILLTSLGFSVAADNICPAISVNNIRSPFGAVNYIQQGLWHQIPCPPFRSGEPIDRVVWFKQDSPTTTSRLISYIDNTDYPESDSYAFGTSGFSLVIKGIKESDEGRYLCQVIPRDTTDRTGVVDIQVLDETFPGGSSQASSTASFQRGRRQTLQCECASQTPDVVYWSTGEGVTTDTQIIGARFSDGTTLQVQHGADYSIGSDASLAVNSLNDIQDTQKFWCHVFQLDGTLRNCDTNAKISDELESASDALKASERSFYLQKDMQQILPCLSWTPGDTACEVEWSKLDNPDRQVLSYNLSTGVVDASPEFDLVTDFGLVIQSVDDDHAGVYRCAVGDENQIDVEVRVIGDRFPLDDGTATEGDSVTFNPKTRFSLQCPALSVDISLTRKATLFWSFGATDEESTTVIGTLNLPDGPIKMADLGKNCLGISMEGALLLNNCSQDGDVRYWCVVFPANDDLIRSYVDVLIGDSNGDPESPNVVAIIVCVPLFVVVLLGIVLFLVRKRRRRYSHNRKDNERGDYKRHKKEPAKHFKRLAKKIKQFVISKMGRIPITPWVARDDVCFAPIDTVYRPLEMFANVSHRGNTVQYQLDSESSIFDDGIPELASKHAIIQGRRGCGKTTLLYRLIHDWAKGKERALWGSDQIVVLVPAWLLIKAKTIGEAVIECMLLKDANISAESIYAHFARDKSNLTVLVDDCNDKDDIDAVIKVMTDNEFLGSCHLVLTTRNTELAKSTSRKYNMRHVTITGFTLKNAVEYINVVLDAAQGREESTPEHKVVKSEAETKSASTMDTQIEQHLVDTEQSTLQETKESTATDENVEKIEETKTTTRKKKRNLHRYLEQDILQPDLSCLPAVLVALCQMSIWTKGDAFKPDVTMTNLFFRLVKCMFDRVKGVEVGVTEGRQLSLLTEDQVNVLEELGRVAYQRLVGGDTNCADFPKEDFLSLTAKGENILEVAIKLGLLCPLQVGSKIKSTEHCTETVSSEVSEVEIRTGCLCCKRKQKQQNGTERENLRPDTELTPLTSPKDEKVCFVYEILEQLCVGVFLPQTTGKMKKWVDGISNIGHTEILQRFSNVFQFAIQDNQFDREAIVDYCAKIVNREYSQVRPPHVVLQLQKFAELCLQLNFEGQWEGALNKRLKSIFPDGRVRLLGISSYKLRLLTYLLEHAQPEDKNQLDVKSVELLRIGRYDWSELQEYIEYFISEKKGQEKKKKVEKKIEDSRPSSRGIHQGTVPASQEGIKKLPEHQSPVTHSPESVEDNAAQQKVISNKTEPRPEAGSENQPISEPGQTTATYPRNDMEISFVNRTQQTDQSQCNTQQPSLSNQHVDNEQKPVATFPGTDMKNKPKTKVQQSSVSDAKVEHEKAPAFKPQVHLGNAPETHQTDKRHSTDIEIRQLSAVQPSAVGEPLQDPEEGGKKSEDLSLSETGVDTSPSEDGRNEDEFIEWSVNVAVESCDIVDMEEKKLAVLKLRKRIESSNQDMPKFPPDESDISVLHIVQSFGLQELLESQAGECYSSGAARDLARYLPRLGMLKRLVLVGTILSSDAICDLAKSAHKLPNLKKLDLRLNKRFDDRTFVAVTNLLLRQCRKLTDLRLSLYRVTIKGFDEVQTEMKGGEFSWGRLKTLYLLHGSPAETFVGFLSNSLSYFHSVKCFHLSATCKSEKIHDNIQGEFDQNMTNPKIMPHLEDLNIGNMETLKARLASLKLPKKEKGSVISNLFGTTVTDPGKKTTSGMAESVAYTLGGAAVCAGATAAMSMPVDDNHFST
ncbi:uncharacterized protein LOC119726504 isoform X2 [Patiria miniata]|uniref:Ig-like domain-containing protein n=1 Tax=Patiria miniata TaxID=46514 RepID=A0A913ZRY1_PATMI|nr:uncharacterized protein LOC119726504 isoform X2 [Patiria miniata]